MRHVILVLCILLATAVTPVAAQNTVLYTSQPDELAIFLNDIAYARDSITLPGDVEIQIILPDQIYQDTLILRENEQRVANYRITRRNGQVILGWKPTTDTDVRAVTLEYLVAGISWIPKYDMWLGDDDAETVDFDFFAEISNFSLSLEDTPVKLIAGRVDISQPITAISSVTANQFMAGYAEPAATGVLEAGAANIQYVYEINPVTASPEDVIYTQLQSSTLPARRLYLWNAGTDKQVTVIYKANNTSEVPFIEGIVRNYQNDLFLGSDFIELTPIGSEGSITVGFLQDVRVNRSETITGLGGSYERDTLHEIELTLTNFGDKTLDISVVDYYAPDALDFRFSAEPDERQSGNIFRWEVTVEPNETLIITYEYKD